MNKLLLSHFLCCQPEDQPQGERVHPGINECYPVPPIVRGRFGLEQRCARACGDGDVLRLKRVYHEAYKHPDLYDEEVRQRAKGECQLWLVAGRSPRSTWRRQLRSNWSRETESDPFWIWRFPFRAPAALRLARADPLVKAWLFLNWLQVRSFVLLGDQPIRNAGKSTMLHSCRNGRLPAAKHEPSPSAILAQIRLRKNMCFVKCQL
eukprot:s813_g18.t1